MITSQNYKLPLKKASFPIWLLVIYFALIPGIIIGGYLFYRTESHQLQNSAEQSLQSIGQLKVDQIVQWRSERMGDAYLIMESSGIEATVSLPDIQKGFYKKFINVKEHYHYSDILLADTLGKVLSSTGNEATLLSFETLQALKLSFEGRKPIIADLHYSKFPKGIPQMEIAVPLLDTKNNKPFGAIILSIDARQYLYTLLQKWPVPVRTSETLIVRREGDRVLFLNELRHQKNTALKFSLPLTYKNTPAIMAAMGKEGIIKGIDYRGKSVIAMLKHIPDSPWYMVAKIDTDEAFATGYYRGGLIFAITLLLLASVLASTALFWKNRQKAYYEALYQSEFEKRALQKHFEYLVKYANDIIILADGNLRIVEINDRALEEYGYSRAEITRLFLYDLIAEGDYDRFYERLRTLKEETSYLREGMHKRKDGSLFQVEISGRYIDIEGIYYYQGIIRDITARKLIEEELKNTHEELRVKYNELKASEEELTASFEEIQSAEEELAIQNEELRTSKERAEESDRLKTAFLQNMSHEIRTPMNAIVGFSQLMEENLYNPLKIKEFSQIITNRSSDLLFLINEILEVSRIETGQIRIKEQNCDVNHLLDELYSFFVNYKNQIGKDLIKLDYRKIINHESIIATDMVKFKQIFINLIQNSLKYTLMGQVTFGYEGQENGYLVFFVSDTGIGIPEDKYKLIFERFMQINPGPDTLKEGLGLGLSIVKGLVTLLGGKIWLKSELNRGTTFYFTMPDNGASLEEKNDQFMISSKEEYFWKDKAFLIVEDEPSNQEYFKELFAGRGARVIFVSTGKEAIEVILFGSKVDLILMDIGLPDMSGLEAAKKIKAIKPYIPIIAQTAYAMENDREQSFAAGCDGYISKPIFAKNLFNLISSYVPS
jgi:PAS domain S-box-containing protein